MVSTVGTCYPLWLRRLQQAGVAAAGFELDLLLEGSCSISKAQRLAHPEQELCPEKIAQIQSWLSRREAGEPVANICWAGGSFMDGVLPSAPVC